MKILTHLAHSSYQRNLAHIPNTDFYHIINGKQLPKSWDANEPKPDNIHEISEEEARDRIKEFDLMLLHSHGFIEYFKDWDIRKAFLEHTGPYPDGGFQQKHWGQLRKKYIDLTVFITHSSLEEWRPPDGTQNMVIYHAMDVDDFPQRILPLSDIVMTTVNAFIERDWCCGYQLYQNVIWKFKNAHVYGYGNENLGPQAKGPVPHSKILEMLQTAGVYFNPSIVSPIPMSMLEAMAVGTPVATTAYYEPGRLMTDGVHGIVSNSPTDLRNGIQFLLDNPDEAKEMGEKGKELVRNEFTLEAFIENWQKAFEIVV